ncbi:MAG: ribosomal subunit interface protein [Cryomorphaceae bacterium]|nr:ribosomal subunit interface protein [Cryomorphaceae bacterium]|tara:strand:- start:772 stop:1059 length:288 start_codon:yes stop_codon:yes gene_type:complete
MDTQMHAVHFKADQKLLKFIQEKLNKLEQFNDQIVSAEVFLRLENDRDKENKIAEIKLHVPGKDLFAKKQCKSFEEAADFAVEALRRQIMKGKTR